MTRRLQTRRVSALVLAALLAAPCAMLTASPAQAGKWMRTSCLNPDPSGVQSDGWSGFKTGGVSRGSDSDATCAPGKPMLAILSAGGWAAAGSAAVLQYSPPAGSTLAGGSLFVGLAADGYDFRNQAIATAAVLTPENNLDGTSTVLVCAARRPACQSDGSNYYGAVALPADLGGNLYVAAGCLGGPFEFCNSGGSRGAWSLAAVGWAKLLLSTQALPTAAEFRGSLLEPGAHGTAGLAFTAGDSGPGVYKVVVTIDGKAVYDATPNTNSGKCVPVGTDADSGELMWDWQQPCPQSQTVDLTVRTTTLADGPHELAVTVINPARDASTVLRRTITTNNRTTVSSILTSDKPVVAAPVYAVELDAPTQALIGGVRRAWGRSGLTLSGTLRNSGGVPAPGVPMTLFAQNAGQGEAQAVAQATTDAAGRWVLVAPRGPSRVLSISYGQPPDPASAQAIRVRQTVKPNVSLRVRALGRGRLRFSGRLRIDPLGKPRPLVVIQTRNRARRWQAVGSSLRVSPTGAYSIIYNGGANVVGGSYAFRTVAHATSLFATGVSPIRRAVVR